MANFGCRESCTMVFTETWLHQDLTLFVSWKDFLTYALTGVWCRGKTRAGACVFITNDCWRQCMRQSINSTLSLSAWVWDPFICQENLGTSSPTRWQTLQAPVFVLGDFNHLTQVFNCMLNLRPDRRKYWLNVVKWTMFTEAKPNLLCPLLWNCSQKE